MKVKMTVAEALQFADEWTEGMTFHEGSQGWHVVCAVLAAEVRRLQSPAVEAVPLGYALANLDGTIRNHGDGELMVYRNPFSRSDKTDCIPLYMHPPSLDGDTRNQFEDKLEMVDDGTLKLVLELCHEITMRYSANLHPEIYRRAENLRVKLEGGDE